MALALLGRGPPPIVDIGPEDGHSKNGDRPAADNVETEPTETSVVEETPKVVEAARADNVETKPTETPVIEETPKVVEETHIYENVGALEGGHDNTPPLIEL